MLHYLHRLSFADWYLLESSPWSSLACDGCCERPADRLWRNHRKTRSRSAISILRVSRTFMLVDKYFTDLGIGTRPIYFPLSLRSFTLLTALLALVSSFFYFFRDNAFDRTFESEGLLLTRELNGGGQPLNWVNICGNPCYLSSSKLFPMGCSVGPESHKP